MLIKRLFVAIVLLAATGFLWNQPAADASAFSERPDVQRFMADMVSKHGFSAEWLASLFARVTPRPSVAKTMTGQVVKPPSWIRFRANFITTWRIVLGARFWKEHAASLARARQIYGVPEEIIVAIIGVETRYGSYPLPYPVLDTLATLAFDYPRRGEFYRGELEQYLLLMREEGMDPLVVKGSFAGAMGIPQFMPSSYRAYAVDFDGDGRRNLWSDPDDAIGSVANYLKSYGWEAGQPIASRAYLQPDAAGDLLTGGLKPELSVETLMAKGVSPSEPLNAKSMASLQSVDVEEGREYWLGFKNFYVITRYNRSLFYALAVYQLGNEIRESHDQDQ
jgi:membrane-bound lytic murein transglycosylase B